MRFYTLRFWFHLLICLTLVVSPLGCGGGGGSDAPTEKPKVTLVNSSHETTATMTQKGEVELDTTSFDKTVVFKMETPVEGMQVDYKQKDGSIHIALSDPSNTYMPVHIVSNIVQGEEAAPGTKVVISGGALIILLVKTALVAYSTYQIGDAVYNFVTYHVDNYESYTWNSVTVVSTVEEFAEMLISLGSGAFAAITFGGGNLAKAGGKLVLKKAGKAIIKKTIQETTIELLETLGAELVAEGLNGMANDLDDQTMIRVKYEMVLGRLNLFGVIPSVYASVDFFKTSGSGCNGCLTGSEDRPFQLLIPEAGENFSNTTPTFAWGKGNGADKYFIRVMRNDGNGDGTYQTIWERDNITCLCAAYDNDGGASQALQKGESYRVVVYARDSGDSGIPDRGTSNYIQKTDEFVFHVK